MLYLIEFLHQTTTMYAILILPPRCILLNFYIKPQRYTWATMADRRCILLNFYIKPQPVPPWRSDACQLYLIEFLHQTTTFEYPGGVFHWLYLIEFLHQTTTPAWEEHDDGRCILLYFYIKPQQEFGELPVIGCCILLNFYIKPQLNMSWSVKKVVSYWISTSNHNWFERLL